VHRRLWIVPAISWPGLGAAQGELTVKQNYQDVFGPLKSDHGTMRSQGDYAAIRLFSAVAARNNGTVNGNTIDGLPERRGPTANFAQHGEAK